jgi:hypothetical protein
MSGPYTLPLFGLAQAVAMFRAPVATPDASYRNVHYVSGFLFPASAKSRRLMLSAFDVIRLACALQLARCGVDVESAARIARQGIEDVHVYSDPEADLADELRELPAYLSGRMLASWNEVRWELVGFYQDDNDADLLESHKDKTIIVVPLEPLARLLAERMIEATNRQGEAE